jgi:hypothetical protein
MSLMEALELLQSMPASRFQLDLKGDDIALIDAIIPLAQKVGVPNRLVFQCETSECLSLVRVKLPEAQTLARVHDPISLSAALEQSPHVVQLDADVVTPEIVERIHRAHSKLLVKVLDEVGDRPETWAKVRDSGADILLSDKATAVQQFCGQMRE